MDDVTFSEHKKREHFCCTCYGRSDFWITTKPDPWIVEEKSVVDIKGKAANNNSKMRELSKRLWERWIQHRGKSKDEGRNWKRLHGRRMARPHCCIQQNSRRETLKGSGMWKGKYNGANQSGSSSSGCWCLICSLWAFPDVLALLQLLLLVCAWGFLSAWHLHHGERRRMDPLLKQPSTVNSFF